MAAAHFKVDPKLAALLGENYRSSEEALRELVDNAWDADAEDVVVDLPRELTNAAIVIRDDGTGMTEREVREEYLYIANDRRSRKGEVTTGKKRPVKGRKGIGKFAGLMVAGTMALETRANGRKTTLQIKKADLLATARADLEKIDLPIAAENCNPAEHGTTITLSGLAQNLAFPSADRLRQMLVFEYDRKENFRITVDGKPATLEHIPGEKTEASIDIPGLGLVRIRFTISDSKPLKHHGIVIRVGGKVVGRPTSLGLDDDETIPKKLHKRVYGEVEADGLLHDVTADWGAIIENSLGLGKVKEWAARKLRDGLNATFKNEIALQKARLQKEIKQRLDKLPENRRAAAEHAVNAILERFFGESDDRIKVVVTLLLEAFENDDYWLVFKSLNEATRSDVAKLAGALNDFGIVDLAVIGQQAARRQAFLTEFDLLIDNAATLEKDVHAAIEKNLWLLGSSYRLIASNESLARLVAGFLSKQFVGERANKRPDLFLACLPRDEYLIVEFKRPSHSITRDDEMQAVKYRDDLAPLLPNSRLEILVVGGGRNDKVSSQYKTDGLKVASYFELVSRAREDVGWLIEQLRVGR